jgi:hypothetical protein
VKFVAGGKDRTTGPRLFGWAHSAFILCVACKEHITKTDTTINIPAFGLKAETVIPLFKLPAVLAQAALQLHCLIEILGSNLGVI